jgi:hypothetical protein
MRALLVHAAEPTIVGPEDDEVLTEQASRNRIPAGLDSSARTAGIQK